MAEYDYIIVGAGSAGGALGGPPDRKASSKVLLLEAGRASHPYSRMPLSFGLLIDNPAANWLYQSEPEPGTANRAIPVPRGKLLGGSSSINGLVWVRGQPLDYDTWAQMGCRGWSWQDVAPLFTRIENFVDGDGANGRGTGGPLKVSTVPDQNPLYDALFKAAVAAGYKLNPDYNSEDQEGVVKTQTTIYKGRRMSVAHCYLEPAMKRPNLHVVTEAHDAARAARRQALRRRRVREGRQGRPGARAREMILSAGGVATPQILELSGIGQPEMLKQHGIEVKHELPAVGENFRDHINARIIWRVKDPRVSYNHMARGMGAVDADPEIPRDRRRLLQPALGAAAGLPQDAARARDARRADAPRALLHQGPQDAQAAGLPVDDDRLSTSSAPRAWARSTSARPIPRRSRRSASTSWPTRSTSAPWSTASA